MRRQTLVSIVFAMAFAWACFVSMPVWPASSQKIEEELGRKYAAQIEEQVKLSTDQAFVERVERIGKAIADIANENEVSAGYGTSNIYKFDYKFKVIEDKDVNAFSLPGGMIYVNTGLLEVCESDDELAGVLAHEVAHSSHHHMMQLANKQSKFDKYIALIALAGVLTNMRNTDLNNLIYGAQLLRTGKLSSLTQEAETDADRTAVAYMAKSSYNPEGMMAFMKKLETIQEQHPSVPLGIYQDHPPSFQRVTAIAKAMQDEGIKIDMRKARDVAYTKAVPVAENSAQYKVTIGSKTIWEPADIPGGATSKLRAETVAIKMNALLDHRINPKDISIDATGKRLTIKNDTLIELKDEDHLNAQKTDQAILENARSAVVYAIWADWLCNDSQAVREETKNVALN